MSIWAESPAGVRREFASVRAYTDSPMWSHTKLRYRTVRPMRCFICNAGECDLHHRTYERIGREELDDLVPLCEDHHHEVERLIAGGASRWDAHLQFAHRPDHEPRRVGEILRDGKAAA